MTPMPLDLVAPGSFAGLHTILTDIDDTLTNEGRLGAAAYAALESLSRAGLRVIPITGRPAGWCDLIARLWPVAGVVGENGALGFRYDHGARRMIRVYAKSETERVKDRLRLTHIAERILREVKGAAIAADQTYRIADLAIDFCEDVAPLAHGDAVHIQRIFEDEGATAKISSIHVNGWFGQYDKLTMIRRFLREEFNVDLDQEKGKIAFIGDSLNDEPMFAALALTVGVANIQPFLTHMQVLPRYITSAAGGQGFAQFAQALLQTL